MLAPLLLFAIGGAVMVYAGVTMARTAAIDDPGEYLRSLDGYEDTDEFQQLLSEPFLARVLRPMASRALGAFSSVLPANYVDSIRQKLLFAGLAGRYRPEEIVMAQVLLAAVGFVLALGYSMLVQPTTGLAVLVTVGLPVLGAMYPTGKLTSTMKKRREALLKDLPDTLDLLAISVEAGVGFEGALEVVCENFQSPLADEFSRTLKEMELGLPRREALQNLKKRTEVPDLSNFVLALTQADALGMPIGRVLKTQATEMRTKRRQWAREKAAKLPVKILFPLVLFIFPPVFVIVLGPAAAQIGQAFH